MLTERSHPYLPSHSGDSLFIPILQMGKWGPVESCGHGGPGMPAGSL